MNIISHSVAVYHHAPACIFCGLMIYNGKPLMIYRNKLRMIYKAYALILVRFCAIIYLKR